MAAKQRQHLQMYFIAKQFSMRLLILQCRLFSVGRVCLCINMHPAYECNLKHLVYTNCVQLCKFALPNAVGALVVSLFHTRAMLEGPAECRQCLARLIKQEQTEWSEY